MMLLGGVALGQPAVERAVRGGLTKPVEAWPDRIVVQHRLGADRTAAQRMFLAHGARVARHDASLNVSVLRVDPARRDRILAELEASGQFNFVEPDYAAHGMLVPNDPNYSSQWHLLAIQAPSAWNITTGSTGVPIAMIDSGVDSTHPDLASKIAAGWSFLTGTADTHDVLGHGTITTGAAAAIGNNSTGVAGIAWNNPIMPLVVLNASDYASYSNIASAITYAADHGARIVNISIGGTSPSSVMQSAVNYAWSKGTVIFAASGNGGGALYYPAACQNVVSVGATDSTDTIASFSSYGSGLGLVAPGVNIFSTTNGGGYGSFSGTSVSSPVAAGVAALVLSYAPSLSASALVSALEMNADDLGAPGYDVTYGWGRVNAYKALIGAGGSSVDTTPPTVSLTPPGSSSVQGSINVQGTATDNAGVTRIEFYVDAVLANTALTSPFSFAWNTTSAANGTHSLTVKAYDAANNVGTASLSVSVNNPVPVTVQGTPSISIQSPANGSFIRSNMVFILPVVTDNVKVTQVSIYVDGVLYSSSSVVPYSYNLNVKKLKRAIHTITATVWDITGSTATSAPVKFIN